MNKRYITLSVILLILCAGIDFFSFPMEADMIYYLPILRFIIGLLGLFFLIFIKYRILLKISILVIYIILWYYSGSVDGFDFNAQNYLEKRESVFLEVSHILNKYPELNGNWIFVNSDNLIIYEAELELSTTDRQILLNKTLLTGHNEIFISTDFIYFNSARMRNVSRGIAYARTSDRKTPYSFGGGFRIVSWKEIKPCWYFYTTN